MIFSKVSLKYVQKTVKNHNTTGSIALHIVMNGSFSRLIYAITCDTKRDIVDMNVSKSGLAAANTELIVSRNHMKFVAYAAQSAESAAIKRPIGDTRNASAVQTADIAPRSGVITRPTAPIANTRPAITATTVPMVAITSCIAGDRLFHQSHMPLIALFRPSIAGRSFSPIVAPRFVIITSTVPLRRSNDPERLSSRVAACSAAFTFPMLSPSLSNHSAPVSASIAAALSASDQNMVVSA